MKIEQTKFIDRHDKLMHDYALIKGIVYGVTMIFVLYNILVIL